MSMTMCAFLKKSQIPSKDEWQKSIDGLKYDLQLHPDFKVLTDTGFIPCKLNKIDSGFEIGYPEVKEYLNDKNLKDILEDRDFCITFTFSSSTSELVCILIACLSLIDIFDSIIYFADYGIIYDRNKLETELKDEMSIFLKEIGSNFVH